MGKVKKQDEVALVPAQDDDEQGVIDPYGMSCYQGVPNDVVRECETAWAMSKAVWLESRRRVRDALAPYGQFKQWCADHDESYKAVQDALVRAYGDAPSRHTVRETRTERSLPEPAKPEIDLDALLAQAKAEAKAEGVAEGKVAGQGHNKLQITRHKTGGA